MGGRGCVEDGSVRKWMKADVKGNGQKWRQLAEMMVWVETGGSGSVRSWGWWLEAGRHWWKLRGIRYK